MANYIIIRIGIPFPTRAEADLIKRISDGKMDAAGAPLIPPFDLFEKTDTKNISGMFSIISSDLTANQIALEFNKISTEDDESIPFDERESFPVLVFKVDQDNFSYNKDLGSHIGYGKMINKLLNLEQAKPEKEMSNMSLDDLLDKMNQKGKGFDSLNDTEKILFKKLSQNL